MWVVLGSMALVIILLRMVVGGSRALTPLPVMGVVPEFRLVDQTAEAFGTEELRGRPWVASFVYSTCPGPCPMTIKRLGELKRRLSDDPRVMLVSISVDPQEDTPEVLAVYGRTHAIDPARWRLLTGDYDDVIELVRNGFFLPMTESEEDDPALVAAHGRVTHSSKLVLIDPELQIRGYYDSDDAADLTNLAGDALRLLDRPGS
jgi:protein SCO1/2